MRSSRLTATLAASLAAAATLPVLVAVSADAHEGHESITVTASRDEVRAGEQFVVRGALRQGLDGAAGAVRVQSRTAGEWVAIEGTRVRTDERGRYRIRLILSRRGERELRVVGNPDHEHLGRAFAITAVTVR